MKLSCVNYMNLIAFLTNTAAIYGVGVFGFGRGLSRNADVFESYQTLLTPASYTFAIWGPILLAQFLFVVSQFSPASCATPLVAKAVGYDYVTACLSQIVWVIAFSLDIQWISLVSMLFTLYFLLTIVNDQYSVQEVTPFRDFWLFKFPFSLYVGWIISLTLINASIFLVKSEVGPHIQFFVAIGSLVALIIIAFFCVSFPTRPDYTIPCVLLWYSVGIYVELLNPKDIIVNTFSKNIIFLVGHGSLIFSDLIAVVILVRVIMHIHAFRKRVRTSPSYSDESMYERYDENRAEV